MIRISSELKAKLLAAKNVKEAAGLIKADGRKVTPEDAAHLWEEIGKGREQENKELSPEELEAVSGGADRDWETDGCAATSEGGWCWSNDNCYIWEVTYDNMPGKICGYCKGAMEYVDSVGSTDTFRCKKCGRTEDFYEADYDVT